MEFFVSKRVGTMPTDNVSVVAELVLLAIAISLPRTGMCTVCTACVDRRSLLFC